MIRLFINKTEYTNYITDTPVLSAEFEDGKLIGNAPSICFNVTLDNSDKTFNSLLNEEFVVKDYETNNQIGVFKVVEKPERITNELVLSLYDNMIETNIAYDTDTTMYPTTIKKQIEEMEVMLSRTIDTSELGNTVLEYPAKWYDNTISIRDFLCFIGELGACNLFCTADGNYAFKRITKTSKHSLPISDVETVDVIEDFECTRVTFDNGAIIPIEKGNETGNTIFVSKDNSYIDTQEQIDYIYSCVSGLRFKTMESMICVEMQSLYLGDIFTFNNINFIALKYSHELLSGEFGIQTIDGNLVIKNAELVTQHIDNTLKIHRLKTEFDQEKLKWSVTAQEVEGQNEKIAQLELSTDEINQSITDVKNTNEGIVKQTNELKMTVDSLTNQITTTGGNNLINDSLGVFGGSWVSENDKKYSLNTSIDVRKRNLTGIAILLNADTITQIIQLPDGEYTLSFSYCKHVSLASVKVIIDTEEFELRNLDYTQFKHTFSVSSGSAQIKFVSDTKDSCTIVNLMLNQGSVASVWSLSQGESYSANFQISKDGATVSSNTSDVIFNMKNDIVGFKNKNTEEYITNFTDVGIDVKEITVTGKARILGLLFQEINNQIVVNKLGR